MTFLAKGKPYNDEKVSLLVSLKDSQPSWFSMFSPKTTISPFVVRKTAN